MPACGIHSEYLLQSFEHYKADVPFLRWRLVDSSGDAREQGESRRRSDYKNRYSYVTEQFESSFQRLKITVLRCVRTYPEGRLKKFDLLKLTGSLHVSCCGNNIEDLSFFQLAEYLQTVIQGRLKIPLSEAYLRNIEFGVNIMVDVPLNSIFDNLLSYKGHSFERWTPESRGGNFKPFSQFYIKLYRKAEQVLRFEIHYSKMAALSKFKFETLLDLTNINKLYIVHEELLLKWKDVVLLDYAIEHNPALSERDREFVSEVQKLNYWKRLYEGEDDQPKKSRQTRLTKRCRLKELSRHFGINLHEQLAELIFDKWEQLFVDNSQAGYLQGDILTVCQASDTSNESDVLTM
jgi:hypothetical protein